MKEGDINDWKTQRHGPDVAGYGLIWPSMAKVARLSRVARVCAPSSRSCLNPLQHDQNILSISQLIHDGIGS